jgi:hypothetical protein
MTWKDYAKLGMDAYSGYSSASEQRKVAKDAAKGKQGTTYQTPYANELLAPLIRYILQQQQATFESRMRTYGGQATNFDVYRMILNGISPQYSGVGQPGQPLYNQNWG